MSQKRTLSEWLTNRYLLIIRNEENFAEKKTITFNYARIILIMALGFLITLVISTYLVTSVLEKWLDPRHAQLLANRQIIQLSMSIDSLEYEVASKNQFIENIKMILDGGNVERLEGENYNSDRQIIGEVNFSDKINPIDSQFRAEFEQTDLGLISLSNKTFDELKDMYLFNPVDGILSDKFNATKEHFGVDIVSTDNEPIKSVADGVVIFSSWTLDGGYVLAVQHRGNLISLYKHNSELLKNVGSFVSAGEILAIIGNTGELTSGPHLHLELWHNGNPVNPENYLDL